MTRQPESSQIKHSSRAGFRAIIGGWIEWGSVLCLLVMLGTAVWSVEQARWFTPQPSLLLILVLAIVTGLLLFKTRVPDIAAHAVAVVIGAGVVMWQAANLVAGSGIADRFAELIPELVSWWRAARSGEPSPGTIQVALVFGYLTWLIGYVSTWFVLKRWNPWVAILLGAVAVLVNLSNLTEQNYGIFFVFLLAALFLATQVTLARHYLWFQRHPLRYPKRGMSYFLVSVFCLNIMVLSLAWLTPEVRAYGLEATVRTKMPWREDIEGHWRNFFATVQAKKPALLHGGKGALRFGGSLDLSDQVLFIVNAQRPRYWRTQTYDVYTNQGWLTSSGNEEMLAGGSTKLKAAASSSRSELTYTVAHQVTTDVLLTTGEFVSSNIPVVTRTLAPVSFDINLSNSIADGSLPPDIASLAGSLRTHFTGRPITESEVAQNLSSELRLVSIRRNSRLMNIITVARRQSQPEGVISLSSPRPLEPEQSYTATAQVSTPTSVDLAQAGEDYPQQITDRYLQLPPALPARVRQLAGNITSGAETAYAKAVAIRDFLFQFPYSLTINAPPPTADGVDYFLFTQQAGYCVYFASAMSVMLRSVGVPTRLNAGYLSGLWDTEQEGYVIRDMDFHAWPEIYFPGYGWVEFEATPGRGLGGLDEDLSALEDDMGEDADAAVGEDSASSGTSGAAPPWAILGILGIIAVASGVGLVSYRILNRFTGLGTVRAIYARMCLLASLARLGPQPQQTPLEYSLRLLTAFPQQAAAVSHITEVYTAAQYGRDKAFEAGEKERLQQSWRRLRRALLKRLLGMK